MPSWPSIRERRRPRQTAERRLPLFEFEAGGEVGVSACRVSSRRKRETLPDRELYQRELSPLLIDQCFPRSPPEMTAAMPNTRIGSAKRNFKALSRTHPDAAYCETRIARPKRRVAGAVDRVIIACDQAAISHDSRSLKAVARARRRRAPKKGSRPAVINLLIGVFEKHLFSERRNFRSDSSCLRGPWA
jgi:hypothetical protein